MDEGTAELALNHEELDLGLDADVRSFLESLYVRGREGTLRRAGKSPSRRDWIDAVLRGDIAVGSSMGSGLRVPKKERSKTDRTEKDAGGVIRELVEKLAAAGITQTALIDALPISKSQFFRMKDGTVVPTKKELEDIRKAVKKLLKDKRAELAPSK